MSDFPRSIGPIYGTQLSPTQENHIFPQKMHILPQKMHSPRLTGMVPGPSKTPALDGNSRMRGALAS